MGTSRKFALIAAIANRIRNIGLISWGFLVGCGYAGIVLALKGVA